MKDYGFCKIISLAICLMVSFSFVTRTQETDNIDPVYNHLFGIENIEGWTVYINKEASRSHPEEMEAAMEHLEYQLYQVASTVPQPALTIMREKVPIWIEWDTIGIAYHGRGWLINNGYNPPDVPTLAGFGRMKKFLNVALDQPSVVLHELAHGYDFRYLRQDNNGAFPPIEEAYQKAVDAGEYESVLSRYSNTARHYGITMLGEYFAEASEAYFGVNDFYPFIRPQLKEFDPDLYNAIQTAWGIDKKQDKDRISSFLHYINNRERSKIVSYTPTTEYTKTNVQGWNVYINPELKREKAVADAKIKLLGYKLHMVKRYLSDDVIEKMQETNIWLEKDTSYDEFVTYCHSADELRAYGLNPDMLNSVVIWNAGNFDRWASFRPSILLNRLAMAYYDHELDDQAKNLIRQAWQNAQENEAFHSVLRFDGSYTMHPALTNSRKYFAEMTETCYGINDHYPFIRFELREYFPDDYSAITSACGGEPRK